MSNNSLSFITSYFIIIPEISALPPPSVDLCFSVRTPPSLPIAPPALLLFEFQIFYSLRSRFIYTGRIGVWWWWGFPYGGGGWHDDDDGEGWHGDMIMVTLHLMVYRHFLIQIISLAYLLEFIVYGVSITWKAMYTFYFCCYHNVCFFVPEKVRFMS